ncbi:hypothetical protein [Thermoanaerobacterium sp. DL9XJH110]|uniref:hypothetical protein n=1 Tax=Thermoanaerobacterium sp. DL9XJH110 TaxID=3386643 RepID=UPI003BB79F05
MDRENYIRLLEQRHRAYFDVYRNHPLGDRVMDLYAVFHLKNRRFFLTKVLDEYEVHEYRMVKCCDTLDFNFIREFGEWLKGQVKLLVRPDLRHMCTTIIGAIIAEKGMTEDAADYIKRYKCAGCFGFGLMGWCDTGLLGVDIISRRVVANRKAREVMEDFYLFQPQLYG